MHVNRQSSRRCLIPHFDVFLSYPMFPSRWHLRHQRAGDSLFPTTAAPAIGVCPKIHSRKCDDKIQNEIQSAAAASTLRRDNTSTTISTGICHREATRTTTRDCSKPVKPTASAARTARTRPCASRPTSSPPPFPTSTRSRSASSTCAATRYPLSRTSVLQKYYFPPYLFPQHTR